MNPEILQISNQSIYWLLCAIPVVIAVVQSILYSKLSLKNAPNVGLDKATCKKAFKSGLITSIGPSIGVFIVFVGLMSVIGGPMTWLRLSIIGSAPLELMHAEIGAEVMGVGFGGPDYGIDAMVLSWTTLALGTQGWIWFVLLFAPKLEKLREKIGNSDPKWLGVLSSAAMVAVFGNLSAGRMLQGTDVMISVIAGALIMVFLGKVINVKFPKLAEYSVGIAMLSAMTIASVANAIL